MVNPEIIRETIEFLQRVKPLCKQEDYDGHTDGHRGPLEKECQFLIERLDNIVNN